MKKRYNKYVRVPYISKVHRNAYDTCDVEILGMPCTEVHTVDGKQVGDITFFAHVMPDGSPYPLCAYNGDIEVSYRWIPYAEDEVADDVLQRVYGKCLPFYKAFLSKQEAV